MIVVRLKSGMGNQMFQYAFGKRMAKLLEQEVKFDLSALLDRSRGPEFVYRNYDLDVFALEIKTTHPEWILKKLSAFKSSSITRFFREQVKKGRRYIKEPTFDFQSQYIEHPQDNAVYEGWFQSYKYLQGIEDELRSDFKFSRPILENSKNLHDSILSTNSVCLNVRRTDFIQTENLNVTNLAYFHRGAEYIVGRVENPHFYIFSDDVQWCKKNISLPYMTTIVDHSHKGYKFGNYLRLLSACKHFIIPNSSFAWWGAWLSDHEEKIIVCPKMWFNDSTINTGDLIPDDWVRL